jgi:uncharacterized membrane protein YfcA
MIEIGILCVFAFVAGFIDSIAGGGGLMHCPRFSFSCLIFPLQCFSAPTN